MLARKYLLILNIINASIFIFILYIFSFVFFFEDIIINSDGNFVFFEVIRYLKDVFTYSIYFCLYIVAIIIAYGMALLFSLIPGFDSFFILDFINMFFKYYLGNWFSFPKGEAPNLEEVPDLIIRSSLNLLNNLYLFSFIICYIIAIIYFIRAIFQNDPKW